MGRSTLQHFLFLFFDPEAHVEFNYVSAAGDKVSNKAEGKIDLFEGVHADDAAFV